MSAAYFTEAELKRFWSRVDVRGPDECWKVHPAPYRQDHIVCEGAYYLMTGQRVNFVSLQPLCKTFACCNPDHHRVLARGERRQNTPESWWCAPTPV